MTFITKKHLSRRTFLRGAGVAVALPFMESMIPAQTPLSRTAATSKSRLACIYFPHGATMDMWTPAKEGAGFEVTEILKPLEPLKDYLLVVSGLDHPQALGEDASAASAHTRAAAVWLTGAHPQRGARAYLGPSMDQVAARSIGQDTPLPSLELCLEEGAMNCGSGLSCAYRNTISWQSPTQPLPMENNPKTVFQRLFGAGGTDAERRARRQEAGSLLDSMMARVASLDKELPAADRSRLSQYLDDIREIERRIERAGALVPENLELPDAPVGIPASFADHVKLMFDLQVLAFQTEITRIASLMFARELSNRTFPESGVRDPFHNLSHHSYSRELMDRFAIYNQYHVSMLGYFLDKLKATPDGDGNLLDHSMILYGSGLSDGNEHNHHPLPILVAGGASGKLKGGRHIANPPNTHMSNLLLAMLHKLGIHEDTFGDSNDVMEI